MYLLDTNICIYVLKNSYPALTEKVFSFSPSLMLAPLAVQIEHPGKHTAFYTNLQ